MKSTLVFTDNIENSKRGLFRGLVIFPIYIILTLGWFLLTQKSLYDKHIDKVSLSKIIVALTVTSILIVSAIGVHTPNTARKAIVYGALVGLVVYGVSNSVLLATSKKWGYVISLIDIIWGVISTALLGYILYIIVEQWPSIFKAKN